MSVIDSFTVEMTPWGGAGLELPIGFWFREGSEVGDGSGGAQSVRLRFSEPNDTRRDSKLYSLEQAWASQTGGASNISGLLQVENMGLTPPQSGAGVAQLDQVYGMSLLSGILASGNDLVATNMRDIPKGLFLGSMIDIGTATGTGVVFHVDNVDLTTLTFGAMGLIWDSSARSAIGGPKRPPGSIFAR